MRIASALVLASVMATPAAAQDLQRPEGWMVRFDNPAATEADLETFVEMPPGYHITTGPAAIFYDPGLRASGDFRAELEVFLFDPGQRREAFGIFLGGRDLQGSGQEYTYFLIRNGGEFILKRRQGADAPTVRPWTAHEAIRSYADRGDDVSVRNVLAVEAQGDRVRFFVNGEQVADLPRAEVPVDGQVGIRVNHALNLHVARLAVAQLG
ncbi:MAG: hypothetical protein RH859_13010 [Longimicrobiales bacterium]